ncbi:MAG: class I SAM-dependent methyltransferase [Ilumatobacteraceae bacterium]
MVHPSARGGYEEESGVYAKARPSYHRDLIERFEGRYGRGVVVDLGAGTGIFTGQLIEAGCVPIAIEPVGAMRQRLTVDHPDISVLDGTAEDTGLQDGSVDCVVVAQAFHWFNHADALREIHRILRAEGHLVCVWNVRDESVGWVREFTDIVDLHAGSTPRHRSMDWRRAIDADPLFEAIDDWSVPHPIATTPEGVVERALSTSFIAALDHKQQQQVLEEVGALAQALGDQFEFPYRSELQAWRKTGRPASA